MVEGGGFEPPKAEPADLQSAPFDRSGIPPSGKPIIMEPYLLSVNNPCKFNEPESDLRKAAFVLTEDY